MLTVQRLKEVLRYDPKTGNFYWLDYKKGASGTNQFNKPGAKAGYRQRGYIVIHIDGIACRANRLAFLYMTGKSPLGVIDHKDRILDNNRWNNLRDASHAENRANSKTNNKYGFKGIMPHRRRWKAAIRFNKKLHYIGIYKTKEEAHAAYMRKAREIFGEFARAA